MKQTTFASVAWEKKGKITRRKRFLAEMDAVIPWSRLLGLIEPHYPKAGNGTQPKPMEQMLRIYFMRNWFNLSDPRAEDSLYDMESMRRFAGLELAEDAIPDESTILRFRHLLEKHQLTEQIFSYQRFINRCRSSTPARGEHAYHVVKRLRGITKVRYRGLAKNTDRLYTAFALANLYMLRRRLISPQGTCQW
ncbi:MAG TPA: transposase [Steroidobacteraceae bacterium]